MTTRVPACPSFEEVARLPSDVETARQDPIQLSWFETAGRSRLAIHTLVHVNVWDLGVGRPRLAYRVPTISDRQSAVTGDGALLVVVRGRGQQPGSDTHVVDTATGADLRVFPPRNTSRPGAASFVVGLPSTTLAAGIFIDALTILDAATGRMVVERDFAIEPLPPGRNAARPTEPQPRAPYSAVGAAASQGGAPLAFTTSIAKQVTLQDGRRGWVQTRAVDVWALDGPRLRLLRTIPIGGFGRGRAAFLVMDRDGRHALVGVQPGGFVPEVDGVSHLYFPRNAPPRLVRVDLFAGRVVAGTEAMLPKSSDGRSAAIGDMALDPQGRFLAITYGGGGPRGGPDGVLLFDPVTLEPACNIGLDGRYLGQIATSQDGALLALAVDGMVRVLRIPASVQVNAR